MKAELRQLKAELKLNQKRQTVCERIRAASDAELEELHSLRRLRGEWDADKRAHTERLDTLEHNLKIKDKIIEDHLETIKCLKRTITEKVLFIIPSINLLCFT